ncbi:exported hypothetical protein [Candidatus Sulfotelmatomonas gaucii]|uniref:Uncharacterized protein n=1 Tax=Candidatus Sulfuritelmatomonas gaucii TaxID=2043161 RepID=A0A2N9L3J0_9BACT|nr:exported hypothetical protein [Candidatus Sulfotelmatomonas gaucii]
MIAGSSGNRRLGNSRSARRSPFPGVVFNCCSLPAPLPLGAASLEAQVIIETKLGQTVGRASSSHSPSGFELAIGLRPSSYFAVVDNSETTAFLDPAAFSRTNRCDSFP